MTPDRSRESVTAQVKSMVALLDAQKGKDITVLPLEGKASFADYMIVVSASSARHAISLAQKLERLIKDQAIAKIVRTVGREQGDWILLDAEDIVTHIFRKEVREFYNIESLWSVDGDNHRVNKT